MSIIEVTPKLNITPQITNSINFSRTIASSYFEYDSFFRIFHFTRRHTYIDGSDTIEMKPNDGTNDNEVDTLSTAVANQYGINVMLPTTFMFSQRYDFTTPNQLMLNTTYVNKIVKLVSIDQSLMELIFTFNSTPGVSGSKYTIGNLMLNVVEGNPDLVGDVLTVTPNVGDDICITISVVDYTETWGGEGFGFNTLVSGKYMPAVTALNGSDTHIVIKMRWLEADFSTYVNDWVVLQNSGESPTSGSFYLTVWQTPDWPQMTHIYIGAEPTSYNKAPLMHFIPNLGSVKGGDNIIANSRSVNLYAWRRMTDYTNDSVGETWSFSLIPLTSNLLWYGNDIFLVYYGECRLSDNTLLNTCYSHYHGTSDSRVVERTTCRARQLQAVVYQSTGVTCSWSVCGTTYPGTFADPCRRNNAGTWENRNLGPLWTRITGDFRGIGCEGSATDYSLSVYIANIKSNLTFDLEACERVNVEYLIEPDFPNTLYVNDYLDHTHMIVHGTNAEYGATLEALLGTVPAITDYTYDHGALTLNDVLGDNYYATPHRYILAYDSGYHIVDLEWDEPAEPAVTVNWYIKIG